MTELSVLEQQQEFHDDSSVENSTTPARQIYVNQIQTEQRYDDVMMDDDDIIDDEADGLINTRLYICKCVECYNYIYIS